VKRWRKRRCICVPDKERSAARVRTFADGDYVKTVSRLRGVAGKMFPHGKINVQPRSSSNVNSNPKQTQRSNMGSIPG